jgi:hypothetical protein
MTRLTISTLALALGLITVACGGSSTPPPQDPSTDPAATMPAAPENTPAPPAATDAPATTTPPAP